ncbi:MAG TPA: D-glycero-beta-D-manno-heptose-7-phosphate kinase [Candidatus Kryptonia bacterium]|nr:D-glycero-beta-D-manno-heptose-7-phosphate kinase [Candidatus Kryptonia bacterium]
MKTSPFEPVLRRFGRVRVLVVGDLILDQFIWGRVERISPEAPVPVVQVTDESFRLGGAANVVNNVRALGGQAAACGVVGIDAAGRRLVRLLREIGAGVAGVCASRRVDTTRKTRIVAHQQQVVRLDRDQTPATTLTAAARALRYVQRHLREFDVVVVSDYGKGVVSPALLSALAEQRRRRRFHYVIDPKKQNFTHYRGAGVMTPNAAEASQATGIDIHDERSLRRAGALLLERWDADAVLITRGERGMTLFKRGGVASHFPTAARHVFDVTGAGDTVVAACALALGAGASLEAAAILANHAAGIVVGEVGTATVSLAALRANLGETRR